MEEQEEKKDRNSEALKMGVILGLLSIIITVLIYIIDISLLGGWQLGVVMLVISAIFVILFPS